VRWRHSKPLAGITALLMATSAAAMVHMSGSARGTSVAWHLGYPQTMSYHVLTEDPSIKCNQTDSVFDQEVTSAGLANYEIYMANGMRGSCGRLKGEQLKRLHPQKMVIAYEQPNGTDPRTWPGGTWAGYYLMMNRTTAMTGVTSTQTQISVGNSRLFSVGDTAVMWWPTQTDPYASSEWLSVRSISGSTLTVTRNYFGTGARSSSVPPLIAAAVTGPSYPQPAVNLSDMAPVNPANGERGEQWMAASLIADFAPSVPGAPTLDAMELDAAASSPLAANANGSVKNVDCNGDGIIDYCQRNVGSSQQVDSYGVGYDEFVQQLQSGLSAYDTDPTRPPKMLLADGEIGLRSVGSLNGAEFESYPSWDNYTYSSPALATLGVWQKDAGASGSHLSYAFTKDATPIYPGGRCVAPPQGTCRNADYRYGMASALLWGGASAYNDEASFSVAQPWDEEATIHGTTTQLAPGYLGAPLGPAVRVARYSSNELAVNGDFEQNLLGVTTNSVVSGALAVSRDTTTHAPGGSASVRADVSRLTADPQPTDARVFASLSSPVTTGEYTVDFWARAQNPNAGPHALNLNVNIMGVNGAPQEVLTTNVWTHYYLEFQVTTPTAKPDVRFAIGLQIGSYWIDHVSVHRGTAGIVTRQFKNGIVVLNDSFTTQTNIALPGGPYHHINGVQDRTVNNGASVGSTLPSIASKDGMILLRG
jgi:hypothetical protein